MPNVGPVTKAQLARLARSWKQGQHVLISGSTGSGKTVLARELDQIRLDNGGHVVVFVAKLRPDATLVKDYRHFTRWKKWKRFPTAGDKAILLYPPVERLDLKEAKRVQREVFAEALNKIAKAGNWTIHIDEGLYFSSPTFLGLADEIAMMHQMGRSSGITMIDLTQRPSHLPLVTYSSAEHAFLGRTREAVDLKRLSELGGREGAKELAPRIAALGKHDFLWLPVGPDWPAETLNTRD